MDDGYRSNSGVGRFESSTRASPGQGNIRRRPYPHQRAPWMTVIDWFERGVPPRRGSSPHPATNALVMPALVSAAAHCSGAPL